ncbi:MAG: hypothetical protein WD638_10650 [Nitriliruptoraceae bacterium]
MDLTMIEPVWWIVLGVLVVLLVGLLVWSGRRRAHRTERLKGQFKSEYDRTASSASKKKAEEDLESRTARRSKVELTDLGESDADSLREHLDELLRSFVDGPQGAAVGMTQLVGRVAAARGYDATEGSVLDLVSVDHPEQVAAMRRAEAEMEKAKGADLTEASRLTFLDARALAERLLAEGRAGHLEDDASEPLTSPAQRLQSDTSADVPPPPVPPDEAPAAEPNRGTDASATSGPPPADGPQAGRTTGGSPRR